MLPRIEATIKLTYQTQPANVSRASCWNGPPREGPATPIFSARRDSLFGQSQEDQWLDSERAGFIRPWRLAGWTRQDGQGFRMVYVTGMSRACKASAQLHQQLRSSCKYMTVMGFEADCESSACAYQTSDNISKLIDYRDSMGDYAHYVIIARLYCSRLLP